MRGSLGFPPSVGYGLSTPEAAGRVKAVCLRVWPLNNTSAAFVGVVVDECARLIIGGLL